jgi:hypothetical protein
MSNHLAIIWKVRSGTEDEVRELFRNYGRPEHTIRDEEGNEKGKLLATQVFMRENVVVRVVEFEGEFLDVAPHMGRQQVVRELEEKLDPYLENPRDMSTPEGARKFFMETAMETVIARRHDE